MLTALEVSGSCTERGTEPSAPRWKTIVDAAHGVVDALVAAELALDDLDVEALEVRAAAGREVVEHAHLVAPLEQRAHEVRADEAGAPGDEHARSCELLRGDGDPEPEPGDGVERDARDDPDRVPGAGRDEDPAGGDQPEEPCRGGRR